MSSLMEKTLREFSDLLASSEPVPGGGSTAALSGFLGTALTLMVANLTFGKKSYELLDEVAKNTFKSDFEAVRKLNEELRELVDEDTQAYKSYIDAVKMPKETEEDKALRADCMKKAGEHALEVPLSTAGKCLSVLKHQLSIARNGFKNSVSDVGVGALLTYAGLEGAVLNVKINLPFITDKTILTDVMQRIDNYIDEGDRLKTEIVEIVNERIGV